MANTLKFGNGQWATKKGSTLAYNDENGNFKPLPFDFSRPSSATRVNKQGLIQVVSNNETRIDFKDDANGALLLEPQRTNLVTTSEDFVSNSWFNSKGRMNLEINSTISPDGTLTATKFTPTNEDNAHYVWRGTGLYTDGITRVFSVFLKYGSEEKNIYIDYVNKNVIVKFNSNGVLSYVSGGTASNYNIEEYSNGWYRVSLIDAFSGGAYLFTGIRTENNQDGTSFFYAWGAQLEQGSYATSYIPTNGSIATRIVETCNNAGNDQVINSTEGVLYLDFKKEHNGLETWSINDGTSLNRVYMGFNGSNFISQVRSNGGASQASFTTALNNNTRYKCALAYKLNDFVLYINGVQVGTDNSGVVPLNMSKLSANASTSSDAPFFSPTNGVELYNTRLSNAELQALTTI